ncbi:hypothetical protein COT63_02525 [Candidatus Shapirobacteria bacterium CG09_land_8_20_14_0_10_38_17]|uniref:Major facilitator superfamily (MFS) profile domain-containing protein n=1 Tax=Candidatus Shapirobacteria bacterium CG09_land_8_20_14_0_10_38_17 TaxID=1974884 RepID=A0A2H0WQS4_9BACT|nr:MAG: hypothetical protein COT63_02525 [Candidatus Shapirobacteria bacterium CG09_land_8_20_14_0_10_38_17]
MHFSFKGLWGVYLTTFLLNFGLGLVGLFIPIYIWRISGQISFVFYFFALYYLGVFLASPLAGWLFKKFISPDFSYFLSIWGRLLYLYFLVKAGESAIFLWPAAFIWGLTIPFCWFPYYLTVTHEESEDGKFGKEVSSMGTLSQLASAIAPVLGGLIVSQYGFSSSYFFAGLFFAVSFLPLYFDHYNPRRVEFSLRDSVLFIKNPKEKKLRRAFFGSGLEGAANIAWPLFIFSILGGYQVLGWIKGLSLFFSILILMWVGHFIDKKGKGILNWGVGANFFNWLLRILAFSPLTFFIFDFLATLGGTLVGTPFQTLVYEKARGYYSPLEIFVARDWLANFGGFLACLLLAFLTNYRFFWFFAFALGALGTFLIRGNDGEQTK